MRWMFQLCLLLLVLLSAETRAWGRAHAGQNIASGGPPLILVDCADPDAPPTLITQGEPGPCGYEPAPDVRDGPNLYAYVKQNPWSAFDPDGLDHLLIAGGVRTRPEVGVSPSYQHDKTPSNFTNAAIRNAKNLAQGGQNVTIFINQPSYDKRGAQDGKNYTITAQQHADAFNKANPSAGQITVSYYKDKASLVSGLEASAKNAAEVNSVRYYGHQAGEPLLNYGEASDTETLPHTGTSDPATAPSYGISAAELANAVKKGKLAADFVTRTYGCTSSGFAQEMAKQTGAPAMGSDGLTDYSKVGGPHGPQSDRVPTSASGFVHYDKTGAEIKRDAAGQRPSDETPYKP